MLNLLIEMLIKKYEPKNLDEFLIYHDGNDEKEHIL